MPPRQWDVVEANLNPVVGSEQSGVRPVLVVSKNVFNQVVPNVTILPLTSARRSLYPAEVRLPSGTAGQPRDSIVMAHQIRTISQERLRSNIGFLADPAIREAVRAAMRRHLDLD